MIVKENYIDSKLHKIAYAKFREYLDLTYSSERSDILGLSTGYPEPGEFPLPKVILQKLAAEEDGVEKARPGYGWDAGSLPVRELLVELENKLHGTRYSTKNICMVAGATYGFNRIIEHIFEDYIERKKLIVVSPTYYLMLDRTERVADVVSITGREENDFQITAAELINAVDKDTKAIFLANPTNPTYLYYSEAFFKEIIPKLERKGVYLIIDESGDAFHLGTGNNRLRRFFPEFSSKNVIRIVTASKKYLLAEYRIGYVLADEEFMGNKQKGFIKLIGDDIGNAPLAVNDALIEISNNEIKLLNRSPLVTESDFEERMNINNQKMLGLRNMSINILQSNSQITNIILPDSNFNITFKINTPNYNKDISFFYNLLKETGVSLLPCSGLGLQEEDMYFRLTYGIKKQNLIKGLELLLAFLDRENSI
ncbi:TPA: pyridoxal phosphate-dependent aminotransferase [Bacillus cereus]|nr:pyridoxal phosphate-dependent aminotransferase [Bacillus cereus]